jgi:hypothetical protein
MRGPLIACAGTVPLVPGAGAAAATPARAGTTDPLLCTSLSYTLVDGVCVLSGAQLGQPYEAPLFGQQRRRRDLHRHRHGPARHARAIPSAHQRLGPGGPGSRPQVNSIHVTGLAAGSPRSGQQADPGEDEIMAEPTLYERLDE